MSVRTILAVVGASHGDEDVRIAADLCAQADAHLSILVASWAPEPMGRYPTMTPGWVEQRDRSVQALKESVERARQLLGRREISYDVDSVYSEVAAADYDIGERSIYCDLLLVGPDAFADADLKRQVVGGGLLQSGRPLLLIPPDTEPTLQPKTVLLAWDSRAQSARAAREALEMMTKADSVRVTMVDPTASLRGSGDEPGADVATYLARHGIKVTVDTLPSGGKSVAQVLQQHAVDVSADIIVMGAYGHSRMREFIFGGVTRSMLDETKLPVLMAR